MNSVWRFQTKFFAAAFTSALIALAVAGGITATMMRREINDQIESTLVAQVKLAAEVLTHEAPRLTMPELDAEADRLAQLTGTRVTLVTADGRVMGDSSETLEGVAGMENHAQRPEIVQARHEGLGRAQRHSDTINIDMLYVALLVPHPAIAFVRVALPLTTVRTQLGTAFTVTFRALAVALVGAAFIAWVFSARIGGRVQDIADIARRYQ